LPDGKIATQGGWIAGNGSLPFYASLGYDQNTTIGESLSGLLQFATGEPSQFTGSLLWGRAGDPPIIIGKLGKALDDLDDSHEIFARLIEIQGSRYRPPRPGQLAVDLRTGTFHLTGPDPGFTLSLPVRLNDAHVFVFEPSNPHRPSMRIDAATGCATGRITLEVGGAIGTVTLHGIADQVGNKVSGFFVDESGAAGAFEVVR
jgi:hypothetical protein